MKFETTKLQIPVELDLVYGNRGYRHDYLIISEGFYPEQQSDFNDHCDEFVNSLVTESWFSGADGANQISISRCFIDSQNGPSYLATPPGWPPGNRVMFSTGFLVQNSVHMLFGTDDTTLDDVVNSSRSEAKISEFRPLVLVNYDYIGGTTANGASWCSTFDGFPRLLLHELGHTFNLVDEYSAIPGKSATAGGKVRERNACSDPNNLTWKKQLNPSDIPLPTSPAHPSCQFTYIPFNDMTDVGAFAGGYRVHCGAYRPSPMCRMKNYWREFCPVCQRAITEALLGTPKADSLFVD